MGKQGTASAPKDWQGLESKGSGTSTGPKRASGEVDTTKESPSGQGKGKQEVQQGPGDVSMEGLTFQLDLGRGVGF